MKRCVLRLDIDKDYEFFTRNLSFFKMYWLFVASHMYTEVLSIDLKQSTNGKVHVYMHVRSKYCEPPMRYLLESAMGGDLARTWYNYHRYTTLGMDIDILFIKKRRRDTVTIPQWLFQQ